jgi:hypothetical protein
MNAVNVLLNNGGHGFAAYVSYPLSETPIAIVCRDFSGDGVPDVATASFSNNYVQILFGRGDGTLNAPVSYGSGSGVSSSSSLIAGDLNQDGLPDLALASYYGNSVNVLISRGGGAFAPYTSYLVGGSPISLTAGDFNGDGHIDLAAAVSYQNNAYALAILISKGDGTFNPYVRYAVASIVALTAADFNNDGRLDVAYTCTSSAGYAIVALGHGDGTFSNIC